MVGVKIELQVPVDLASYPNSSRHTYNNTFITNLNHLTFISDTASHGRGQLIPQNPGSR